MRRRGWMIFAPTYFEAYLEILKDIDDQHYPRKRRTVKKHCNRATSEAVKLFPEFRDFERGRRVFTFATADGDGRPIIAFTAKPKQRDCSSCTVKQIIKHRIHFS